MSTQEANGSESFTARIAMWSARRRRWVALGWVLLVMLAFVACQAAPVDTDIKEEGPGEAGKGLDLFRERFGEEQSNAQEIVVFSHPSLNVDDPEYQDTVIGLMEDLRALREVSSDEATATTPVLASRRIVSGTITHYETGLPREQSPFVAQNDSGGDVTFTLVDLEGDSDEAVENVDHLLAAVEGAQTAAPEFTILEGGGASQNKQIEELINEDFSFALFLNIPITLVILVLAFGALLAALVPLALAIAAIIVAAGILSFSQVYPLSEVYIEIVLLMGLATGIDYALFVVSRYRTERRAGHAKEEALQTATATSGKAVVFAGAAVLLAISGMFLVGNAIFSSLAVSAIVVVAMAILISVTLLPMLIAFLGDNLETLRVPFLSREPGEHGGVWGVISDQVLGRPAVLATLTVVVLLVMAVPLLTLNLGFNGAKGLSDDVEAKKALLALEERRCGPGAQRLRARDPVPRHRAHDSGRGGDRLAAEPGRALRLSHPDRDQRRWRHGTDRDPAQRRRG